MLYTYTVITYMHLLMLKYHCQEIQVTILIGMMLKYQPYLINDVERPAVFVNVVKLPTVPY